jgi:hypothetical protein
MTDAERQRRHRHGSAFRDKDVAVTKPPVTKPPDVTKHDLVTKPGAVTKPSPVTKPPDVTKPEAPVTKLPPKPGLAEKLEPLIETLFEQGLANMNTMAPVVVMIAVTKLERLLVEYGIIPPSRRIEDPQGYIQLLKQRARRRRDKERAP